MEIDMPIIDDTRIMPLTGVLYYNSDGNVLTVGDAVLNTITTPDSTQVLIPHTHPIEEVILLNSELQLRARIDHRHVISNIDDLQYSLDKKSNTDHTHQIADIPSLQSSLDNKADISTLLSKANIGHTHPIEQITGLSSLLSGYALTSQLSNFITNADLVPYALKNYVDSELLKKANSSDLSTKASLVHGHVINDITGLSGRLLAIDDSITAINTRITNLQYKPGTTATTIIYPKNTSVPTITGVIAVGKTIIATKGAWSNSPTGFIYQFVKVDSNNIETVVSSSNTYVIQPSDEYCVLYVNVFASNGDDTTVARSVSTSAVVPLPKFITNPVLNGVKAWGNTLTATYPTTLYTTYSFEWFSNKVSFGNNASTYSTTIGSVGNRISCAVTATNIAGTLTVVTPDVYILDLPSNKYAPAIDSNNVSVGSTILASAGGWTYMPTFAYQWKLNGIDIVGATSKKYTIISSDIGKTISFSVVATNAKGSVSLTSPGIIVTAGTNIISFPSNPITRPIIGDSTTYNVGDLYDYKTPDTVPWGALVAGDVVNIFYKSTPYKTKIGLRGAGTASMPIVINGVTDSLGNRPTFDFSAAQTAAGCNMGPGVDVFNPDYPQYGESLGGIVIKRGNKDAKGIYQPKFIQIKNLQLQGARNGSTYKTWYYGGTEIYASAAGVYVVVGEDLLFENLVITNNGFGIFTQSKDGDLSETCKRVVVRNCKVYENGVVDSYLEHGAYIQGISPIIEGNYFGQNRAGSTGSSYKSRASGEIFRYNWVESQARAMDFVHSEDSAFGVSAQPDYPITHCYGNVIISDDNLRQGSSYAPIHFGGDNLGEDSATGPLKSPSLPYKNKLYFYNNTYYLNNDVANSHTVHLFDLSLAGTDLVDRTTVYAWNNAISVSGTSAFSWLKQAGELNLIGGNVISGLLADARYDANSARYKVNKGTNNYYSNPGFANATSYDFSPGANSILIDKPTPYLSLPTSYMGYSVNYQPYYRSGGMEYRKMNGTTLDIGAFELDPNTPLYSSGITTSGSNIPNNTVTVTSYGIWNIVGTISYQWYIDGIIIDGATSSSYLISYADSNKSLYCVIKNTNNGKTATASSSSIMIADDPRKPLPTTNPMVISDYKTNTISTVSNGVWTNSPTLYSYKWYYVIGAVTTTLSTSSSYTIAKECIGKVLSCDVTATNNYGTKTITITGLVVTLNAAYDPDANGVYNFSVPDGTLLTDLNPSWVDESMYFEISSGCLRILAARSSYGAVAYRSTNTPKQNMELMLKAGWIGVVSLIIGAIPGVSNSSKIVANFTPTSYEVRSAGIWQGNGSINVGSIDTILGVLSDGNGLWKIMLNDVQIGATYNLGKNVNPYTGIYLETANNTKLLVDWVKDY
jgi:Phage tail repeat like